MLYFHYAASLMTYRFPTERHLDTIDGRDQFQFKELSEKVLKEIVLQMESPNCLGIYGNWGSGKSTLLHFMLQQIKDQKITELVPVYFEPWKYEYAKDGDLLFALLEKIKMTLFPEGKTMKEEWRRLMADLLTIGAWGLKKVTGSLLQCEIDPKDIAEQLQYYEGLLLDEHEAWTNKTEGFRQQFEAIIAKGLRKNSRLLVIIDDLDRCLPDNAVRLLEAMKNFLTVNNTLFIIAIDRRVVSEMIEKQYGLHDGFGEEYLMKIIHYFYELPRSTIEGIVKELCEVYQIPAQEMHIKHMAKFFTRFSAEPRRVKFYMHQLGMKFIFKGKALKDFCNAPQRRSGIQNSSHLIDVFITSYVLSRFPKLAAVGNPEQWLGIVYDRATNSNSTYKSDEGIRNMLSATEWQDLKAIFGSGLNTGQPDQAGSFNGDQMLDAYREIS